MAAQHALDFFEHAAWDAILLDETEVRVRPVRAAPEDSSTFRPFLPRMFGRMLVGSVAEGRAGVALPQPPRAQRGAAALFIDDAPGRPAWSAVPATYDPLRAATAPAAVAVTRAAPLGASSAETGGLVSVGGGWRASGASPGAHVALSFNRLSPLTPDSNDDATAGVADPAPPREEAPLDAALGRADVIVTVSPEPSVVALTAVGLLMVAGAVRRRRPRAV